MHIAYCIGSRAYCDILCVCLSRTVHHIVVEFSVLQQCNNCRISNQVLLCISCSYTVRLYAYTVGVQIHCGVYMGVGYVMGIDGTACNYHAPTPLSSSQLVLGYSTTPAPPFSLSLKGVWEAAASRKPRERERDQYLLLLLMHCTDQHQKGKYKNKINCKVGYCTNLFGTQLSTRAYFHFHFPRFYLCLHLLDS